MVNLADTHAKCRVAGCRDLGHDVDRRALRHQRWRTSADEVAPIVPFCHKRWDFEAKMGAPKRGHDRPHQLVESKEVYCTRMHTHSHTH